MNYFELFDIPVQLRLNPSRLANKYFELSRKYHPDFYINAPKDQQNEALDQSAILNNAMKTFRDPDETIRYVLKLKGLIEEEEKYGLPPDFLLEVLDINEAIMDMNAPPGPELVSRIEELEKEIYKPVKSIIENYEESQSTAEDLLPVKEYYYKKKYLDRIREQLTSSF